MGTEANIVTNNTDGTPNFLIPQFPNYLIPQLLNSPIT
jgi:hypothetical protein